MKRKMLCAYCGCIVAREAYEYALANAEWEEEEHEDCGCWESESKKFPDGYCNCRFVAIKKEKKKGKQ